jgi:hypothetical protein
MTSTVTAVKESQWNKDNDTIVKVTTVTFDDGREVPGYDLPSVPEIGKPLPDDWEVATAKSGKLYIKVPKQGKGNASAAYRNTREGFDREQLSIHRSVAVKLALEHAGELDHPGIFSFADEIYTWLSTGGVPPALKGDDGATERQAGNDNTPAPSPPSPGAVGEKAPKPGGRTAGASSPQRDQLWLNLVDYAGSKKKAVTLVNLVCKSNWTEPHAVDIPEQDLLATIQRYALMESGSEGNKE